MLTFALALGYYSHFLVGAHLRGATRLSEERRVKSEEF
jgi:hypothetical protein